MITLNYQIALTNVPFDNSYKNVMRFDTRSEQETFFNVSSLFSSDTPRVNFNVGSLMATNIVFDCAKTDNINELLNKNYCIVKDNSSNAGLDYYYYFITNAKQENENRISLSIELDIFQTYYIDLKFSDCLIERAHLDRWIDNLDGTVSFNGNVDSPLFEREPIKNVGKRLTKRTKLGVYNHNLSTIDNWLKENVLYWLYVYIDPTVSYESMQNWNNETGSIKLNTIYHTLKGGYLLGSDIEGNKIPSNIAVLCVPIYKSTSHVIKYKLNNISSNLRYGAIKKLFDENGGNAHVYQIKVSYTPPTTNENWINTNNEMHIDSNDNLIIEGTGTATNYYASIGEFANANVRKNSSGVFLELLNQPYEIKTENYNVNKKLTFNISDIIVDNKNSKYNPKLLNSDYYELIISDATEQGFVYDLQKLNKENFNLILTESLTPDQSKIYLRIKTDNNNVYIQDTENNLTGYVNSNDNSIILLSTAFQEMLANNKNFFLQNSINRGLDVVKGGISSFGSALTGNFTGAISGAINTGINYARDKITEELTVDNLKNAPANITGAKGNAIFNSQYSENGPIVEEWDILPHEKEIINDYMCMYGFSYNKIGNIKNYDNIRKYYNYIKADIEEISSDTLNVSDNVLQKFKRLFAQGVRFWNTDTFSYTKENYEKWFEQAIQNRFIAVFHTVTSGQHYYINYKNKTFKAEYGTNKNIALDKASGTFTVSCDSAYGIIVRPITINTDAQYTMTRIDAQTIQFDYTNATYFDIYAEIEPI